MAETRPEMLAHAKLYGHHLGAYNFRPGEPCETRKVSTEMLTSWYTLFIAQCARKLSSGAVEHVMKHEASEK